MTIRIVPVSFGGESSSGQFMPLSPSGNSIATDVGIWGDAIETSSSQTYLWSTDTDATDPTTGFAKGNNIDISLITEIYISETTLSGGSLESLGIESALGDISRIQQYGSSGNYIFVRLTGPAINNGGWWTVPVEITTSAGGFTNNVEIQFNYWATSPRVQNIIIERLYDGESGISPQEPNSVDSPVAIQFGAIQGTSSDPIQTIAQGVDTEASILRINQPGLYRLKTAIQYGRETNPGTAILNFRALINGVQAGRTINQRLNNSNTTALFTDEAWLNLPAGIDITYEVIRDSNGANSGGLIAGVTSGSSGWNGSPTAALRVERWRNT